MSERKLASIRIIDDIQPIEGADAIEVATIGGWKVVVKKGEYKVGDLAVYLEIDSWVPTELASFLSKGKEPREFNGVKGERLRTIKLRGQLSQGLLLPVDYTEDGGFFIRRFDNDIQNVSEDQDVTEALAIQKWERPMNAQLQGMARGNFPSFIRKTDQERCQNIKKDIQQAYDNGDTFEITMKLDGSSMTAYVNVNEDGDLYTGVCSRNLDLKLEDESSTFVREFKESNLQTVLLLFAIKHKRHIAVQGELMGPGIQGNRENLTKHRLFVFDVFDIDKQEYLSVPDRNEIVAELLKLGADISQVPFYAFGTLQSPKIDDLLEMAEGPSMIGPVREGLVFKRHDGQFSFKAISNAFLLQGGD